MTKKLLGLISVIIIAMLIFSLYHLKPNFQESTNQSVQKVNIWFFSPAMEKWAQDFNKRHRNVQIVTKLMDNPDRLLEALNVAVSIGNAPDLVEMSSFYGIHPFIQKGLIKPIERLLPSLNVQEYVPGIADRFTLDNNLWAIPIGYSLPVLYVNQTMIEQSYQSLSQLDKWPLIVDSAKTLGTQPIGRGEWGLNTDSMMAWYIYNLSADHWTFETPTSMNNAVNHALSNWGGLIDQKVMPPLSHEMALTSFVNGKGLYFISSSENVNLIERLIAGHFNFTVLPFPYRRNHQALFDGSGLTVIAKDSDNSRSIKVVLKDLQSTKTIMRISEAGNLIPPLGELALGERFLGKYNKYPKLQQAIKESLAFTGPPPSGHDEDLWKRLSSGAINVESHRVEPR